MYKEAIFIGAVLHLLCWGYAVACEYSREKWPASKRYTFMWVVFGVAMTLVAASFVVGLVNALIVAAYFVASGIPMAVGAAVKHTLKDSREANEG